MRSCALCHLLEFTGTDTEVFYKSLGKIASGVEAHHFDDLEDLMIAGHQEVGRLFQSEIIDQLIGRQVRHALDLAV